MNSQNNQIDTSNPKDFWDSLQMDILTSSHSFHKDDYKSFVERSVLYSLLFRGCHPIEQVGLLHFLNIKAYGYIIQIDFSDKSQSNDNLINEFDIYHFIKGFFNKGSTIVGPMVFNRMHLLLSYDTPYSDSLHKEVSISLSRSLSQEIYGRFNLYCSIGIGSQQSINAIYKSYIDSLSSLHYKSSDNISYYADDRSTIQNAHFDYALTEKYLLEAIRLRKKEAYDYFELLMNWLRPLSNDMKRNKILEILVLSQHEMSINHPEDAMDYSYTSCLQEFLEQSDEKLIEFAYRCFISIIRHVRPQSNIDYTNNIVMATQQYLENHYSEDISLEDVAEQVNISPQYFSKLIKKTTGFNFIDWLSMLRVKKAKELLTNSNYTVKEVCFMVGYKDPNYFSRIFKKRIGITPSEYVKTSTYHNSN